MALMPPDIPFNTIIRILRNYGAVDKKFLARMTGLNMMDTEYAIYALQNRGVVSIHDDVVRLLEPNMDENIESTSL